MARALAERINADLAKAVASPETKKRLSDAGIEPAPGTSDQFTAFAQAELAKWARVIKEAGIPAE
jgi:tripartite-type tricarboxylate transporter receptor subunit TctC